MDLHECLSILCTKDWPVIGRRSKSFPGSKEVAVVDSDVMAVDEIIVVVCDAFSQAGQTIVKWIK